MSGWDYVRMEETAVNTPFNWATVWRATLAVGALLTGSLAAFRTHRVAEHSITPVSTPHQISMAPVATPHQIPMAPVATPKQISRAAVVSSNLVSKASAASSNQISKASAATPSQISQGKSKPEVRPGPPIAQLAPLMSSRRGKEHCAFSYGCIRDSLLASIRSAPTVRQAGFVKGADGSLPLARLTPQPGAILEGELLCWDAKAFEQQRPLLDRAHCFNTSAASSKSPVRRAKIVVHLRHGKSADADWYYYFNEFDKPDRSAAKNARAARRILARQENDEEEEEEAAEEETEEDGEEEVAEKETEEAEEAEDVAFHCDACGRQFVVADYSSRDAAQDALEQHQVSAHAATKRPYPSSKKGPSFACEMCGRRFFVMDYSSERDAENALAQHVYGAHQISKKREGQEFYVCDVCGRKFFICDYASEQAAENAVDQHELAAHPLDEDDSEDVFFECNICNWKFYAADYASHEVAEQARNRHEASHGGNSLMCQRCGLTFPSERARRTHQALGNCSRLPDLPMHECRGCQRKFKTEGALKQHEEVCPALAEFECAICGQAFNLKLARDLHQQMAHGPGGMDPPAHTPPPWTPKAPVSPVPAGARRPKTPRRGQPPVLEEVPQEPDFDEEAEPEVVLEAPVEDATEKDTGEDEDNDESEHG